MKNHQLLLSVSFSAHKRGTFSSFNLFETLLGRSRSFQVFPGFPSSPQDSLQLIPGVPFVRNDDFQNVLTCKYTKKELYYLCQILLPSEVSVITRQEAFCFTKRGKQYYKVGLVLQNGTNYIIKGGVGVGVFQSGEAITKKARIVVQKDSDISVLEPQSLKVKLL